MQRGSNAAGRSPRAAGQNEQQLHALSPLFAAAKTARAFIVPAILVLFASGGSPFDMWGTTGARIWATIALVVVAVMALLPYLIFRYTLADAEIVIRDGIVTRTERHIPYSRIQNIDLVQNPVHRAFDVALVRVETASGGRPEAVLRVLSLEAIEQMRARVFAGRTDAATGLVEATAAEGETPVAPSATRRPLLPPLPISELAKLGIASNKGMVVVGAAMGVFWQRQWEFDWIDQAQEYVGSGREWMSTLAGSPMVGGIAAVAVILVLAVVLLRLFSIGWYIFHLHGFTLARVGNDLRAEYGLLNRISRTVPTPRIQALQTLESPLHRAFGRQSVKLQTVGGGMEGEMDLKGQGGGKSESQWLAPMIESERVPDLFSAVHDGVDLRRVVWQPLAQRAWRRVFRVWVALGVLVTVPVALFVDLWALALVIPVALGAYVHARLYVKHSAYSLAPWGLVFKSGWFNRTLTLVRYGKIQTVSKAESPCDRRNGMARVQIDTAGAGMQGHTIEIPYLDTAVAGAVARRLYRESSCRAFRW